MGRKYKHLKCARAPSSSLQLSPATLALSRIQHLCQCEWRLPSWTTTTTVHEGPGRALARVDYHSLDPGLGVYCCVGVSMASYAKSPAPLALLGRLIYPWATIR